MGFMNSLMLLPSGAERWQMTLQPLSFLGTTPMPEHLKFGKGGWVYGPAMRPARHSLTRNLLIIGACECAVGKWRAVWGYCGPWYLILHPFLMLIISLETKPLSG